MSDTEEYTSFFKPEPVPIPPGKRVVHREKKTRPSKRKDNISAAANTAANTAVSSAIPDGYVETVINGMNVLIKKPASAAAVHESKAAGHEIKAAGHESKAEKKPRAKTAWSEYIRLNGMVSKKNTEAYNQFMEQYRQFKEAFQLRRP